MDIKIKVEMLNKMKGGGSCGLRAPHWKVNWSASQNGTSFSEEPETVVDPELTLRVVSNSYGHIISRHNVLETDFKLY